MAYRRRFGQTRYGHVFSKGRHGADRGVDPIYAPFDISFAMGTAVMTPPPPSPVPGPTKEADRGDYPPPGANMTLSELVNRRQALRYGCWNCKGEPRQISPWEAVVRFGGELRISEVREVLRARCRAKQCGLESPCSEKWAPYKVR